MYSPPLKITTENFPTDTSTGRAFDVIRSCAFVLCKRGRFIIKIFNDEYVVSEHCVVACFPFVNMEVLKVESDAEVIMCTVFLEDIPNLINRWINNDNLLAVQQHPVVELSTEHYRQLIEMVESYFYECDEETKVVKDDNFTRLQRDIIDCQSRLIVAQVVKSFLTVNNIKGICCAHRDIVFQRFLLSLYANFREHRDVAYYALRSGLSLKYFSTVIRQLSGSTPSQWIETIVVSEAKTLLSEPHRTIKEIASVLNFPDAPTFTKYFARVAGMTPKAYRQSLK